MFDKIKARILRQKVKTRYSELNAEKKQLDGAWDQARPAIDRLLSESDEYEEFKALASKYNILWKQLEELFKSDEILEIANGIEESLKTKDENYLELLNIYVESPAGKSASRMAFKTEKLEGLLGMTKDNFNLKLMDNVIKTLTDLMFQVEGYFVNVKDKYKELQTPPDDPDIENAFKEAGFSYENAKKNPEKFYKSLFPILFRKVYEEYENSLDRMPTWTRKLMERKDDFIKTLSYGIEGEALLQFENRMIIIGLAGFFSLVKQMENKIREKQALARNLENQIDANNQTMKTQSAKITKNNEILKRQNISMKKDDEPEQPVDLKIVTEESPLKLTNEPASEREQNDSEDDEANGDGYAEDDEDD